MTTFPVLALLLCAATDGGAVPANNLAAQLRQHILEGGFELVPVTKQGQRAQEVNDADTRSPVEGVVIES